MKQDFKCPICNYEWAIAHKGPALTDADGKKVVFREACPNCGHLPRLTSQEIDYIVSIAK